MGPVSFVNTWLLSKILQVGLSLKYKEGKIKYNADLESLGRGKRREEEGSLHLGAAQSPTEGLIHLPAVYHYHQRMEVVHSQGLFSWTLLYFRAV